MASMAVIQSGVVEPDRAYSLQSFKEISGLGTAALREARRKGLLVRRIGTKSFILGKDFLVYLETHGKVVGQDA